MHGSSLKPLLYMYIQTCGNMNAIVEIWESKLALFLRTIATTAFIIKMGKCLYNTLVTLVIVFDLALIDCVQESCSGKSGKATNKNAIKVSKTLFIDLLYIKTIDQYFLDVLC